MILTVTLTFSYRESDRETEIEREWGGKTFKKEYEPFEMEYISRNSEGVKHSYQWRTWIRALPCNIVEEYYL